MVARKTSDLEAKTPIFWRGFDSRPSLFFRQRPFQETLRRRNISKVVGEDTDNGERGLSDHAVEFNAVVRVSKTDVFLNTSLSSTRRSDRKEKITKYILR